MAPAEPCEARGLFSSIQWATGRMMSAASVEGACHRFKSTKKSRLRSPSHAVVVLAKDMKLPDSFHRARTGYGSLETMVS